MFMNKCANIMCVSFCSAVVQKLNAKKVILSGKNSCREVI